MVTTGRWGNSLVRRGSVAPVRPVAGVVAPSAASVRVRSSVKSLPAGTSSFDAVAAARGLVAQAHPTSSTSSASAVAWTSEQMAGRELGFNDQILWRTQLRGRRPPELKEIKQIEDAECLAGLRNPHKVIAKVPGWLVVGQRLRKLGDSFLDAHPRLSVTFCPPS